MLPDPEANGQIPDMTCLISRIILRIGLLMEFARNMAVKMDKTIHSSAIIQNMRSDRSESLYKTDSEITFTTIQSLVCAF